MRFGMQRAFLRKQIVVHAINSRKHLRVSNKLTEPLVMFDNRIDFFALFAHDMDPFCAASVPNWRMLFSFLSD
jgi:hypothetical protein